jgi:hypothetical protein
LTPCFGKELEGVPSLLQFPLFPSFKMVSSAILDNDGSVFYCEPFHSSPPDIDLLKTLARIDTPEGLIKLYWRPSTKQVMVNKPVSSSRRDEETWYCMPDCSTVVSLAHLLKWKPEEVLLTHFVIIEHPDEQYYADRTLVQNFYNCMWSDYAIDKMIAVCSVVNRSDLVALFASK